jgi:hypothetical protein
MNRIFARWSAVIDFVVPIGYEDETGFHYGTPKLESADSSSS